MRANSTESRNIHDLLKKTIISGDTMSAWLMGDGEKMERKLRPICNYLQANAPKKLYRMRRFDRNSIDALKNDHLYFSRADWFNDPYDCLLYSDPKEIKKRLEVMFSNDSIRTGLDEVGLQFPIEGIAQSKEDYVSKFSVIRDEVIDNMSKKHTQAVSTLQTSTFIVCFGESVTSPIMWSHYGDNHKGFAIEYEFESTSFPPMPYRSTNGKDFYYGWHSLLPVFYSKYRADATELAKWFCMCEAEGRVRPREMRYHEGFFMPDMLLRTKLSLEKSVIWSYEKEWRMIITREWPANVESSNPFRIKKAAGIYLGERMTETDKDELRRIAKEKGIPVYEMYIDYASKEYVMDFRKVQ